ncbi:MAG: hypothetical protein H6Q71_2243 [Firmicutes bacterium]|nr:hypothetical protein [Bacillota bacterium]
MNVDNGHLIRLGVMGEGRSCEQEMEKIMRSPFLEVPQELEVEAVRELAGKNETFIDLKAATPLASWATKKRAERDKKKDKRQIAKRSKQRNKA